MKRGLPQWYWSNRMAAWWHSTIKLFGLLEFAARMEEMSHGAGRKERQPWKFAGALIAVAGRESISAAELHARMSLMGGVVKSIEVVMEGIDMFTTVVCSFAPTKHTNLSLGWRRVPPIFLKLWRTAIVLFKFATRMTMLSSLLTNVFFCLSSISPDYHGGRRRKRISIV